MRDLHPAEIRVLRELADGGTLTEIAERMFLSRNTVKSHLRKIFRALGASSREEALRLGSRYLTERQRMEAIVSGASDERHSITILYKSGNRIQMRCTKFVVNLRGEKLASVSWEEATPRPLYINVDEIEAVYVG